MVTIFYLITLFVIMKNLLHLSSPIKSVKSYRGYKKLIKDMDQDSYHDLSDNDKQAVLFKSILGIVELSWLFIGLMTANWILFLIYIGWNAIIYRPIRKLSSGSKLDYSLICINAIVSMSLGLFVLLNHYHLHLNTFEIVIGIFK